MEAFESEEREIERLRQELNEARDQAAELYVFGRDQDAAEEELGKIGSRLEALLASAKAFSGKTKARYQANQQLVPSDLGQHLTGLELCADASAQVMEEKQREQKRARTVRSDYTADLDEIQAWIRQAELKLQDRSTTPDSFKEELKRVQEELVAITDKLERLTKNGRTIAENTADENEKQLIGTTINDLTEQLSKLRSYLDEKKQAVSEAIDAWQKFLALYETVKAWNEEKRQFLSEPLKLSTLEQIRHKSHEYSTAAKSCKQVTRHISDMDKELEGIGQVCSVGDLPDKLLEARETKTRLESQLMETNSLLQETNEEWEQCKRKMRDVATWTEKAKQTLESPQTKKKPLRDLHSAREKMLGDIAIQKRKIGLSMEKLQVHFKSGIGDGNRIGEDADELIAELDRLHGEIKQQTTSLESSLAQIDQYQQEIHSLKQQIVEAEQQLRVMLSPTYLTSDTENTTQEQQTCQERIKSLQSKIQARAERCKIIAQRGTPDPEPLEL